MNLKTENAISEDDFLSLLDFSKDSLVKSQFETPRAKSGQLHQSAHDPKWVTADDVLRESIELELQKTGYPLHKIRCQSSDSSVVLDGQVSRYYYLQVALQIALRFAGGRPIVNRIEVVLAPPCDGGFVDP